MKFLNHYTKKVYRDRKGKVVVGSTEDDKYNLAVLVQSGIHTIHIDNL